MAIIPRMEMEKERRKVSIVRMVDHTMRDASIFYVGTKNLEFNQS